jgi:hypothetical protein
VAVIFFITNSKLALLIPAINCCPGVVAIQVSSLSLVTCVIDAGNYEG